MRSFRTALLLSGVLMLAPAALLASGTYRGGPPRQTSSIDREAYDEGKKVFSGDAEAAAASGDAEAQKARLAELQGSLPRRAQESTDLTALAGKLSADQLDALEYDIGIRYKVK